MSSQSSASSGGVGLGGLVFVAFLVLKLTHVISWSWWWVTAPLWGPAVLVLGLLILSGILVGVARLLESKGDRANRKAREAMENLAKGLRS